MAPSSSDSSTRGHRVLLVIRHAKAEPWAEDDHHRELTPRGRRDAMAIGLWLAEHDHVPTHAFVSSANRARATWEHLQHGSRSGAHAVVDGSLYSAGPDSVLDTLRTAPEDAAVVAYVGHNPTAASLAHLLHDGDPDPAAFRAMSAGFPASAVAVLDVPVPWAELAEGTAKLVAFHVGAE